MRALLFSLFFFGALNFAHAGVLDDGADLPPPSTERFLNLRLQPTCGLYAFCILGLDFKITSHIALGPEFRLLGNTGIFLGDPKYSTDYQAYEAGAHAAWFKNGTFKTGLYASVAVDYAYSWIRANFYDGIQTATTSGVLVNPTIGYAWFWSNLNVMLGGGWAFGGLKTSTTFSDASGALTYSPNFWGPNFIFDASIGWTF